MKIVDALSYVLPIMAIRSFFLPFDFYMIKLLSIKPNCFILRKMIVKLVRLNYVSIVKQAEAELGQAQLSFLLACCGFAL